MTISKEVRRLAVTAYLEEKGSIVYIAEMFGISRSSLLRWLKHYRKNGTYMTGKVSQGRPRHYTQNDADAIIKIFKESPSLTQDDVSDLYQQQTGILIPSYTIARILRNHNWTRKKRHFAQQSKIPKEFKN